MTIRMASEAETAVETLTLLEARLRRLEWLVTGSSSLTSQHESTENIPAKPSVSTRVSTLEHDLQKLASKSDLVDQVLQLHAQSPSLFHQTDVDEVPSTLSDENLASIVLSCAASFPETASRLTSLKDLPIPPASASEQLIKLQPRLDKVAEKQQVQSQQVAELRERSARFLKRWYEVGVVAQGEAWSEWAERLETMERDIRRAEHARTADYY